MIKNYSAVMAGAGTGKTYSLVQNYLSALFGLHDEKKRPQEILALTFTQKAAHEMRLRITKRLSEFLVEPNQDDPLVLLAKEQEKNLPDAEEIKRLLRALPNAPIATFHSFCADFLRKEAKSVGIDDAFEIMAPDDELFLAQNILRPLILDEIKKPSPLRNLIAQYRLGNGLASSGLVDGILKLYFKLFEKGINCDDLASLTSKNRPSAKDLDLGLLNIKLALKDFLALKSSPKTEEKLSDIQNAVYSFPSFEPFNESVLAKEFIKLRSLVGGNYGDKQARSALVLEVVKLGANIVDHQSIYENALANILVRFHHDFEKQKQSLAKLSYSDLLLKTKHALLCDLNLRKKAKGLIKHVLIDEYQDTSPLQEDIVALLLEDKKSEQGIVSNRAMNDVSFKNGPSLFVVGDKKQSIYGFRGADAKLFDGIIKKMASSHEEGFSKLLLTTNRRSKKSILALSNLVSKYSLSAQGYEKEHDLKPFGDDDGRTALWIGEENNDESKNNNNLKVSAYGVVDLIKKGREAKDIVILVRRIKSASLIKEHLRGLGVNARIIGGEGFFQCQEIVDVLSFLRLLNYPGDSLAMAVVLRSPLVLLTDQEILHIAKIAELSVPGLISACENSDSNLRTKLEKLLATLESLRSKVSKSLYEAFDWLMKETDYCYALGLMNNPEQKWANIEKLSSLLTKSNKNPFTLIDEFYGHIANKSKEPLAMMNKGDDACTIMTIHQSKGLEFKVVVLADGEAESLANYDEFLADEELGVVLKPKAMAACAPDGQDRLLTKTRYELCRSKIKEREELEMARLLYVAITRAKDELYIACSLETFQKSAEKESNTLNGLLLRAYHHAREEFLACSNIEFICRPEKIYHSEKQEFQATEVFSYEQVITRVFASQLQAKSTEINSLIKKQQLFLPIIDGDLAHKVLSQVGPTIGFKVDNDSLIKAAWRSLSIPEPSFETVRAIKNTLALLKGSLHGYKELTFELPISFQPTPKILIEGFLDLVVEFEDFIGVIEFKSSKRLVNEPNTYLQVLAYAEALSGIKPVKFAVVLIGGINELLWQDYDDNAQKIFFKELSLMNEPKTLEEVLQR